MSGWVVIGKYVMSGNASNSCAIIAVVHFPLTLGIILSSGSQIDDLLPLFEKVSNLAEMTKAVVGNFQKIRKIFESFIRYN